MLIKKSISIKKLQEDKAPFCYVPVETSYRSMMGIEGPGENPGSTIFLSRNFMKKNEAVISNNFTIFALFTYIDN